jgi:hypothetical protein
MNLLLKYIQGQRKGKDAHRLEREAMHDPFLAEALEGFEAVDGLHTERITSIRKRLSSRTRRTYLKTGRLAAAASLLLCILAGGYFLLNRPSDRFFAQNERSAEMAVEENEMEEMEMEKSMPEAKVRARANHVPDASLQEAPPPPAPEPQIGMKAYREYLAKELIRPSGGDCAGVKGTVEIQFRIDALGKPHDFTVRRSLCTEADREAIRLIEQGCRWEGDPSQPVTLEVTF